MKGGRRVHQDMLTAVSKPGAGDSARLGLAISSRNVPRALDRNRIKRIARESFRNNRDRLGAFDIVILARGKSAATARRRELATALDAIWNTLRVRPA